MIENICRAAEIVVDKAGLSPADIRAIGIGSPGVFDKQATEVVFAPNLPDWNNVPLVEILEEHFGKPVALDNDANAAAWGEFWAGAGKDVSSMVMLTLGTGIGGGIILDGKLWHGHDNAGAELGHITIDYRGRKCACGNIGCIEAYASATSTVKRFIEGVEAGEETRLAEAVKKGEAITTKMMHEAALAGDAYSRRVIEETGELLGVLIVSIVHALEPQIVVLSGGMSNAGDMLLKPMKRVVWERAWARALEEFDIRLATLGEDAGFIGAAGCALTRFGTSASSHT